jgi:type I restriction enzyme S subunit
MKNGNTESHAETRSSRRESHPPASARSALPREKKSGWEAKALGEVLEKTETVNPLQSPNTEFDYIDVSSVSNTTFEIKETQRLKGKDAPSRARKLVRTNDIIFATIRPTLQRIAVVPEHLDKQVCSTGYFVLRPKQGIDHRFVFYSLFTENFIGQMESLQKGASYPAVTDGDVRAQEIPVPPLAEQQRIVGLLDEAFEGLATAKANAEKNRQNARALFESRLQSVFTQRGPGWVEKPFEELIESNIIGLTKNSREQGEDKAWPYVKMNNITRDNRFDFSSFTCVDATPEEVSKFSLKDGDFLFNTRNSHELVGKSCIYESDSNDAVLYNNNIMRVRFQRGIDARFVLLAFSSKGVADELNALKSGTTNVSAIYFKDLKSLVIPVPPIAEQKRIAAKLDALSEETQRLARLYERKHAALEALKKSLLHQAFTGQL